MFGKCSKLLLVVSSLLLPLAALLLWTGSAAALQLENQPISHIHSLKRKVEGRLPDLQREQPLLREDAKLKKMQMAFEYDDLFENYKAKIRSLGDEISQLADVEDNLRNIESLGRQKELKKQILAKKMEDFRSSHANVYIPVVLAAYVEVPRAKDNEKVEILGNALTKKILNKFGVEKIFSEKIIEDKTLVSDHLLLKKMGTLEADGTKSFDRHFINYTPTANKYMTIYFYRFRPFDRGGEIDGYGEMATEDSCEVLSWDMSDPGGAAQVHSFIESQFPNQALSYKKELESYLGSLAGLSENIANGEKRIDYVITALNRLLVKYKSDMHFIDSKIRQLERNNEVALADMGVGESVGMHNVGLLIDNLKKEKEGLEKSFEYRFILMGENSASTYAQAQENAVGELFKSLEALVQKKNVDIETAVSFGRVQKQQGREFSFKETFTDVALHPYVDGSTVGVLMAVSVRYDRNKAGRQHGGGMSSSVAVAGGDFVENVQGLKLKMKLIESPVQPGKYFYVSKTPVIKRMFAKYSSNIVPNLDNACVADLGVEDYPSEYPSYFPLLCVSSTGKQGFAEWLSQQTGKAYRVPTADEMELAGAYGIQDSSDNVMRVVLAQ